MSNKGDLSTNSTLISLNKFIDIPDGSSISDTKKVMSNLDPEEIKGKFMEEIDTQVLLKAMEEDANNAEILNRYSELTLEMLNTEKSAENVWIKVFGHSQDRFLSRRLLNGQSVEVHGEVNVSKIIADSIKTAEDNQVLEMNITKIDQNLYLLSDAIIKNRNETFDTLTSSIEAKFFHMTLPYLKNNVEKTLTFNDNGEVYRSDGKLIGEYFDMIIDFYEAYHAAHESGN